MRTLPVAVIALSLILLAARGCDAGLVLTLSSPDDLSRLSVGSSATFDVTLSGISRSDPPGYLAVALGFDPSVLSVAVVTPGSIIPDAGGFDSSGTGPGVASASYDDSLVPSAPVTVNGVFYSFEVKRIGAAGTSVSFLSFAAQDDLGNNLTLSATPPFLAISPAAVPEASSLTLALIGFAIASGASLRRRHRGHDRPRSIS